MLSPETPMPLMGSSSASTSRPAKQEQSHFVDLATKVRYLDSWRIVACSVAAFVLNLLALILNISLVHNKKLHVFPPAIIGMTAAALALASVAFDLLSAEASAKAQSPKKKRFLFSAPSRTAIRQMICFLAFVPVIVTLVMLTLQAINAKGRFNAYLHIQTTPRTSLVIVDCMALVADIVLCAAMARLVWWPVHRAARSTMIISSLLQCTIATILIAVNWQPYTGCVLRPSIRATATFTLHQHVGALVFTTAIFSFGICCAIKEGDRINKVFTRFIIFYTILASFTVFLLFVILGLAIHLLFDKSLKAIVTDATLTCDPILTGCALLLFGVNFWATHYLQEPPPSTLAVEPIDLNDLSAVQREAFAKLINKHGKNIPDAPGGQEAMSLMHAYQNANMPGMKCIVLRVYKPSKVPDKSTILSNMAVNYSYEDDWAWRNLDMEQMAIRHRSVIIPEIKEPEQPAPPKLSKKQQKKIAKAKAEAQANGGPTMPLSPINSPEELQAELEFAQKLESTEALVMMSQIPDYDLTGTIPGIFGRILRRTLGADSYFKPLCVRLGLLAFHWPFRQATFYTAATKRPVARSAAVLRAVAEWNDHRPRSERCTILLDPTYQHGDAERAIVPSGWQPSPLPPSHVIDLRPYKGKTLPEYLKAIKYRDQEAAFKKAHGEVLESTEFTETQCEEVMRLWRQIAQKRTGEGQTAVLAEPDENMLMELGGGNKGDRSLLFLRADGKTIASCVLFRLGDTITSDLQGLDYELARPLKAYFVMMQHTIAIALKEGKSFVDFGPTTSKPKIDIGCTSVGITGAMYAVSPFLRSMIGLFANKVTETITSTKEDKEKQ
ncbi:hypothetical protein PIIN_01165 [Serendipita indica DSM 11827]|uniref:BioF2-like acetyltransferase domain-containing protein n=1 Tax=Serendipita indica (strain DSM 11827) TaxID=1109443 RepID=G4T7M6_SERID|nr:hypothetical protein PIIN_01165 [Serendipita indica DSM 11827]